MNTNPDNRSGDRPALPEQSVPDIRGLSPQQLAQLGLSQVAYVKPVQTNEGTAFAIHAADGTPMAIAVSREVAVAAILQHEMLPASVH
jgi:hypothetical protein